MAGEVTTSAKLASACRELARYRKAIKIADALDAAGILSKEIAGAPPEAWVLAAKLAETEDPHDETRALVVRLMDDREYTRARIRLMAKKEWLTCLNG